jgi:tetratricopeptide (TPR) repeat protein
MLYRDREGQQGPAADCLQRYLAADPQNGDVWSALGHTYLTLGDLPKAHTAFQQALYSLPNPRDPTTWFGIGCLYDRFGSEEHAEEAFLSVLAIDPGSKHAPMIYYRLGCLYSLRHKYEAALDVSRERLFFLAWLRLRHHIPSLSALTSPPFLSACDMYCISHPLASWYMTSTTRSAL